MRFQRKPDNASSKRDHQQRGTILILAIAVLAVLSLLAVSYVTVVRIDRDSSDAVAVSRDYDQQVGTVIRHMQSLLTADLFGNKVVTTSVPRYAGDGTSIWPSMFEDGEFSDIDWTDPLYARHNPADDPSIQNGRILQAVQNPNRRIAQADDAWLASTEPRWQTTGAFSGDPYFFNFTNLRSAFTWDVQEQHWLRGDGLYVDLAQWFLNPVDGRANAGVNLLDPTGSEVTDVRSARYSSGEFVRQQDGIDYTLQMPQLTSDGDTTILFPADERFFVDTTGDLRPDAQWTQLEELGNLYGLVWVTAARITDASALVNLNTAIESPVYNLNPGSIGSRNYAEVVGTGETPADVDLVRLLTYDYGLSVPAGVFVNGPPNLNRILGDGSAFNNHLADGRGFYNVLDGLQDQGTAGYIAALDPLRAGFGQESQAWGGLNQPLTRNQRRYLYEYAYSVPQGGFGQSTRYPERAMLDLHGFWATNNATLISKPEQYLDGPETGGYLPSSTNLSVPNGPLRAAEINAPLIRAYGEGNDGLPTLPQVEYDIRRLLTTMSGTSRVSPVPVVNKDQIVTEFDGIFFRQQHDLARIETADVGEIFADLVWALAPFATNKEVVRPTQPVQLGNKAASPDYHYGGGGNGPAVQFSNYLGGLGQIGAAYAIHRAGALAVNIIDAADASSNDRSNERPTVLRFLPTTDFPLQFPIFPGYKQTYANARFAHGDMDFSSISPQFVGQNFGGISFIGVDRQPFLVEAHTLAVYQSDTLGHRVAISPGNPDHHVGSIIAFELANPWPDPIDIGPIGGGVGGGEPIGGYAIRIVRGSSWLEVDVPDIQIPAGGRAIVYWHSLPDAGVFEPFIMETVVDGWLAEVAELSDPEGYDTVFAEVEAGVESIQNYPIEPLNPTIPFQDMATNASGASGGQTQVQLILKASEIPYGAANPAYRPPLPERKGDMLIDRMTTISTSQANGDGITSDDFFGGLREQRQHIFETADGLRANGNFRVTVLGNMLRAPRRPAPESGFPGYVVERPVLNRLNVAGHTDASGPGSSSTYKQTWFTSTSGGDSGGGTGPGAGGGDPDNPLVGVAPDPSLWEAGDALSLGSDANRPIFTDLPSFQLFNPSDRFSSVSDVALVSAFCHMYIHEAGTDPNTGYSVLRVNTGSTSYNNDVPGFNIGSDTQGRWLTFSEQLGMDFHLEGQSGSPAGINPWFGKIDPTRYRFGSPLISVTGLPDQMSVPLGSRIFDLFVTMRTQDFLVPGTVNINTAARRVLSLLPLTEPLIAVQGEGGGTLKPTPPAFGGGAASSRASKLFDYRERKGFFGPSITAIDMWTGLQGLRTIPTSTNQGAPRGFVTKGEIPLIGGHEATSGLPQPAERGDFLELVSATGTPSYGPPFETWSDTGLPLSFATANPRKAYAFNDYNPQRDAEEQLALFRAIANIVSTRSDVFMATFVLRGYDPDVIESIEVPGGAGGSGALQAMNDPLFRPAYESRWLVVFDRSNVRQPTDRPRILLRMELPSAVP